MGMFDHLKPGNYGAESAADVGVFMVGAAIGGIADGVLNFAGFAEPLVISGLTGAGALGLKKMFDAVFKPAERQTVLEEIRLEIQLGNSEDRHGRFLEVLARSRLDAEAIRRLWLANR